MSACADVTILMDGGCVLVPMYKSLVGFYMCKVSLSNAAHWSCWPYLHAYLIPLVHRMYGYIFSSLNILCLATQHAVEYPDTCIHHLFLDLVHDIRLLHDTTQSQLVNLTFPDKSLHRYIFQRLLQTSLLGQTGSQSLWKKYHNYKCNYSKALPPLLCFHELH